MVKNNLTEKQKKIDKLITCFKVICICTLVCMCAFILGFTLGEKRGMDIKIRQADCTEYKEAIEEFVKQDYINLRLKGGEKLWMLH